MLGVIACLLPNKVLKMDLLSHVLAIECVTLLSVINSTDIYYNTIHIQHSKRFDEFAPVVPYVLGIFMNVCVCVGVTDTQRH